MVFGYIDLVYDFQQYILVEVHQIDVIVVLRKKYKKNLVFSIGTFEKGNMTLRYFFKKITEGGHITQFALINK